MVGDVPSDAMIGALVIDDWATRFPVGNIFYQANQNTVVTTRKDAVLTAMKGC